MTSIHVETVQLGADLPAGWLAASYERRYLRMAASRVRGERAIHLAPLRFALNDEIRLPAGPLVRFTCYPDAGVPAPGPATHGREHVADPATDPRTVFDVHVDGHRLRVVARRTPYAPFQALLVPLDHRPQEADAEFFHVAFASLRGLGPAYTGTFNVGGRTHDRLHAQLFRGSAPLWDHITSGTVGHGSGRPRERISGEAWRTDVPGWPCRCTLFGSADPSLLASLLADGTGELASRGTTYDLCFRWERDELRVLLFTRAAGTDQEIHLYPPDRLELGKFGALELAGWVLSIRDPSVYRRLVAQPEQLARRYQNALTRIESGWVPTDGSRAAAT